MDEDSRTIYCGNLSSKCTEEILYELFMQAGPLEKVNIPKDRDGNIKTFGFITFKHKKSVPYAVELFEGTNLYNRQMSIKPRQTEQNQVSHPFMNMQQNMNDLLKYGNQILMGYPMQNYGVTNMNMIPPFYMPANVTGYPPSQVGHYSHGKLLNNDRQSSRSHPYNNRERERHRDRDSHRDRHHERDHDRHHHHQSSHRDNRDNRNHRPVNHHKSGRSYR
ncbi:hypothetical protein HCN44_001115 [Aphidius gifuensis]|uniref:RRM domain-containing protein n=1 Tax=Aphidius gifuensis TaxID=684658 RepID=A0A834XKL3_APHGI|nr:RNA-binding protein 7 [Aphidius gifuensis]KAF7988542.1 hypothetical protein HCN44_001115 [Aphidius gifuensis]